MGLKMPATVQIGMLVIGAVLLLIALLSGNFKIFGVEIAEKLESRPLRVFAGALGLLMIGFAVASEAIDSNEPTTQLATDASPSLSPEQPPGSSQSPQQPPLPGSQLPSSPELTVDNVASNIGDGSWRWTVFLQGPEEALAQVDCVEYSLHAATFSPSVYNVCERGNSQYAFGLSATGWGTFEVGVRISLKSGQIQETSHMLRLE